MDVTLFQTLAQLAGVRQEQRLPDALQAPLTLVDHRTLPDMVNVLKRYAENIRFVNLANQSDGNWSTLFAQNPAMVMASVMSINTNQRREYFLAQQRAGLRSSVIAWHALLTEYDQWFTRAEVLLQPTARHVLFRSQHYAREHLLDSLLNIFAYWQQSQRQLDVPWQNLKHLVSAAVSQDDDPADRDFSLFSRTEREQFLLETYEAILQALHLIAQDAKEAFEALLKEPAHDPAAGLLLAFLKTYQQTQTQTNQFSQRLLNFYYQDVLHNRPEAAIADRVILDCSLKPGAGPIDVPEGALFSAGKTADHRDIVYRAIKRTRLTGATLTGLKTLYLQRHANISPENVSQSVTRVKAYDLLQQDFSPPMNVFGYEEGARQKTTDLGHQIGLCIASNTLLLKEGRRDISVEFIVEDNALIKLLRLKNRCHELLKDIDRASSLNAQSPQANERAKVNVLLDTLTADHPLQSMLLSAEFSGERASVMVSLVQALPSRLSQFNEVLSALLVFVLALDDVTLQDWLQGEEVQSATMLKQALLALYQSISRIKILGLIHFELVYRFLFFDSFLTDDEKKIIKQRLATITATSDQERMYLSDMHEDLLQSQYTTLLRYFQNAFECHLTQADGWGVHRNYRIDPTVQRASKGYLGSFGLTLHLDNEDGAVVPMDTQLHGNLHAPGRPVFMLRVNRFARCYPLSWFGDVTVVQSTLKVKVSGFKDITAHNEYGPIDRTKPFFPFSALPKNDAQFYLGGYEFARKRVTQLTVTFQWKGLPKNFGGFTRYYESYGSGYSNQGFNINLTALSHGELIPQKEFLQQQYPLFSWHENSGILSAQSRVTYRVSPAYPRISPSMTRREYDNIAQASHGYLCLRLRSGEGAFGHKQYPTQLSQVLTYNARQKRRQKVLPNEPYTPEISQVEVDYRAEDNLELTTDYAAILLTNTGEYGDKSIAYHISPMGISTAHSNMRDGRSALFPQVTHDGNLFIAFTPGRAQTQANLYFQLANDSTHPAGQDNSTIHWLYYTLTGWQPLPVERILADSTEGLLHSGLVSLSLPDDAVIHPGFQPENQYWLCIASAQPRFFASLLGLGFDALDVQAVDTQNKINGISGKWRAQKDIEGLQSVAQKEPAFAGMATESQQESLVRLYERLRHKNRAITPWDYERLILERFPEVQLAKCLPNCRFNQTGPAPGHVLLALAPHVSAGTQVQTIGHHLNAVTLRRVRELIQSLAPPNAKIDVINATYEYVQVRCAVKFVNSEYLGEQTQQLQQQLSEYLSPWTENGLISAFSWSIQLKELEAFIRSLPDVQEVARVSLVKCYGDHQSPEYFRLQDTAKTAGSVSRIAHNDGRARLESSYPWSLPLPSRSHHIELLTAQDENYFAQPVGINSLEIGNTFVIRGGSRHVEKK